MLSHTYSHVQFLVTMDYSLPEAPLCMILPGKNTGMDCCALLQGIFPVQKGLTHVFYVSHWQSRSYTSVAFGKYTYIYY